MEKQLPETANCLNQIEKLYLKYCTDYEEFERASGMDKAIFMNPMLHLAETIYLEAPAWAEDLAKYLCILCNIKRLDVEINVK